MAVSLVGDGIYFIAIVWEALRISNTPSAVSLVGIAWTVPVVLLMLPGGVLGDAIDRRRLMLMAALTQAAAIGAIGILVQIGAPQLWELFLLVGVYGGGHAFFEPAFEAIVPTLVSRDEVAHASALDEFVRPLAVQLIGPAIGGLIIALAGTGPAFLLDAATFLVSGLTLAVMRVRPGPKASFSFGTTIRGICEAYAFVKENPWLSRTLLGVTLTLLLFVGPSQVLLPFLVKNELHAGSGTLGAIRAIGGVGALLAAFSVGQYGMPRRLLGTMFAGWALQCFALVGYALARGAWLFAAISFLSGMCGTVGNVVWGTLLKTRVPNPLLGRVASLDWLISIGLVPASFALTGPATALLGARATLLCGGLIAGATLIMCGASLSGLPAGWRKSIPQEPLATATPETPLT